MSLVDQLVDPLGEWLSDHGVDAVGDVYPGQLLPLSQYGREDVHHAISLSCELVHGLDLQALELRHADDLHVCALDPSSLAGHQVPHVEDGHGFVGAQVDAPIVGQEAVALPLALVLCAEFCCRDLDKLTTTSVDLILLRWLCFHRSVGFMI